ncbi:MAG: WD40/YVTN/BNR-like repeat-containing protein, partial [Flavobacteriales bacterium]
LLCSGILHAQWQPVPVPVTTTLHSIDSYDAQRLCIGTPGSWLRSTDGGNTWVELPLMDQLGFQLIGSAFYAMQYQSPTNIVGTGFFFIDTYPFQVRRSTDGGTTWPTTYDQPGNGQFTSFSGMAFSGNNGVAVGDLGRIARTTNGGVSWSNTNTSGNTLRDAAWPTATSVVVVGEGRILRSTNSGQTWTTVWSGGND